MEERCLDYYNIAIVGISDCIQNRNDKYSQSLKEYYAQKVLYSGTIEDLHINPPCGIEPGNNQQKPKKALKYKKENIYL